MQISETKQDEERQGLVKSVTEDASALLGVDLEKDQPQAIVAKLDKAIVSLVLGEPTPLSQAEDADLLMGCLWGTQMVRQFNWYWADAVVDGKFDEVAVIAPNQSMIMFPLGFAQACIQKQCVCTIELAFNMLLEGDQFVHLEAGGYANIMLGIHHIVPPYELHAD